MDFQKPNPPQRRIKKDDSVLDEEEYMKRLEQIIKRDFFPELVKIEKFKESQQKGYTQKSPEHQQKLSLNEFLSNFNSEDNVSLKKLMIESDECWRKKMDWIFRVEKNQAAKQLALENSTSDKLQNMICGHSQNQVQVCEYQAITNLYFPPKAIKEQKSEVVQESNINYENTRLLEKDILKAPVIVPREQVSYGEYGGMQTPDILGLKRRKKDEEFGDQTPLNMRGYKLLHLPSPSPNDYKSPLITWGEVDYHNIEVLNDKYGYKIPEQDQKQQLMDKFSNSIQEKKRMQKEINGNKQIQKLLTNTPVRINSGLYKKDSLSRIMSKNKHSSILSISKGTPKLSRSQIADQNQSSKNHITDGLLKL